MGDTGRFPAVRRGRHWAVLAAVALACAISASSLRAASSTTVVPRVNGGLGAAYARLHAAGLPVSLPAWTFGSSISTVATRTAPRAGMRVAPGTTVALYFTSAIRPVLRKAAHPSLPHFVGQRVSAASRWAALHHVSFLAHLGALRRGDAPSLLADYVITAQLSGPRLTVWGRQPPPAPLPPPPPPPSPPSPAPSPATPRPPSPTVTTAAADVTTPASPPPPVTYYQNPVYSSAAFPDPFVLDNNNTHSDYWAFGTGGLFPVLHSTDLVHWTSEGMALKARPTWVLSSGDWHPWAPSVIVSSQSCPGASAGNCYVMYYVGLSAAFNRNCIAVATSSTPGGPYTDQGPLVLPGQTNSGPTMPIGCGDAEGVGNIDPSPFIDPSGAAYLYLSTDNTCTNGSSCTLKPTISEIPLTPGLLEASGARAPLFSGEPATWEAAGAPAPTVEGPSMELHNGTYYLFYSGGSYLHNYGMGYATSTAPTGPFVKATANPFFTSNADAFSVGGGDQLVTGPRGGLWMVYHARTSASAVRTLWIDPFSWQPSSPAGGPDVPDVAGPTTAPQSVEP